MSEEIVNRVQKSGLVTIDLDDIELPKNILEIDIKCWLHEGLFLKEKELAMPFYRWEEMNQKNLAKPSDSQGSIIIGDNITLNRSVSQPGRLARPHTHGCEQLINIVSGTAWFRVGDEEKNVSAGDIVHVPVGTEHEFKNTGSIPSYDSALNLYRSISSIVSSTNKNNSE